jgi:glyoxylase-like metal-dependent hydrolase (beta-lactamase superfamily II)
LTIQQHTFETEYPVGPVHCYSAELNGELVLFDTGPPTAAARESLGKALDLSRLRHVVITHCHIDHYGLAHWLDTETEAVVYLPYRDSLKIARHDERLARLADLLTAYGFDASYQAGLRAIMDSGLVFPRFPESFRIIEDELPPQLGIEVIDCAGHSQSDLVLAGPDWAVTGDVLLRGIFQSPLLDVDLESGQRFRNYDAYCATIGKLAVLRGKRILPGHRQSVDSVDACILFYVGKLFDRARQFKPFAAIESVAEVIEKLFDNQLQNPFHVFLKASEIIFMRDFLADPERLKDALTQVDLFTAVAERYRGVLHD